MKATSVLYALALATAAFAQHMTVCHPASGTTVQAGQPFDLSLAETNGLTGFTEVGVAVAVQPCNGTCPSPTADNLGFGNPLLVGPFHASDTASSDPLRSACGQHYGNVSITIPEGTSGPVVLGVGHFFVLGASNMAEVAVSNVTLNVA